MPKISVVVPVFNAENSIKPCVLSILSQSFTDFELVLVNDGSSDRSVSILEDFVQKDSRVKIIHQQNKGTGEARNTGIMASKGEYICFVDSDDSVEPQMLIDLLSEASEEVDIVVCDFNELSENGKIFKHSYTGPQDFDGYFKAILSFQSASSVWAKLFHRKLFDNNLCMFPANLRNNEDNATLYKILYFGRNIKFVSKPLYNWKRGVGSKSRNINKLRLQETIFVLSERKIFLQKHNLFESSLAEYYTGVLYTITLRKAHIQRFAQSHKRQEYMQLLHTNILQMKLIDKRELLIIREKNTFDYWRLVFLSFDNISGISHNAYEQYFDSKDWMYALECFDSCAQPEMNSLSRYIQGYAEQSIYIYGIGDSWLALQKVLPVNIRVKGFIDKTFEGKSNQTSFDLDLALQSMPNKSIIVVASISQARDMFYRIKKHPLCQKRQPVVITFAGVTHF